jgi:hypothetical protein
MNNPGRFTRRRSTWRQVRVHICPTLPRRPIGSSLVRAFQEGELLSSRGPDSRFRPLTQVEDAIGGSAHLAHPDSSESVGARDVRAHPKAPNLRRIQTSSPAARPGQLPLRQLDVIDGVRPSFSQNPLSQLSAAERSHALNLRKGMMNPYLQFTCGPLLRYDTIDNGVWHGAALIVSEWCFLMAVVDVPSTHGTAFVAADAGSTYDPSPTLKYRWDLASFQKPSTQGANLNPQPTDPMAHHHGIHEDDGQLEGPNIREQVGTELYVYIGRSGYVYAAPCYNPELRASCAHVSSLLAHTRFGDSSFRFRFPILI